MKVPDFIPTWADAIARFEGFYSAGSRPARNHNPGDLKFAGQPGAIGQDSAGFAIFPDDATGFQALYNQLAKYVRDFPDYSLLQIMAHYLGQHDPTSDAQGNAFTYAGSVAGALGVDVNVTLADLSSSSGDTTATGDGGPVPGDGGMLGMAIVGALALWLAMKYFG
jgi:hypothetical protein